MVLSLSPWAYSDHLSHWPISLSLSLSLSLVLLSLSLQVLFEQFKFFLNLYFLTIAMTQFIPQLRIGYLYTYWGPLVRMCVCGLGTLYLLYTSPPPTPPHPLLPPTEFCDHGNHVEGAV